MKTIAVIDDERSIALSGGQADAVALKEFDLAAAQAPAPAITAKFNPGTGVLTITGNGSANSISFGVDATGAIVINGGQIAISGGTPTIANTASIQVSGAAGDDVVIPDPIGNMPPIIVSGGTGNDTINGGAGADQLNGDGGNDTINGGGGADTINAGDGADVVTGGVGSDTVRLGAGNDTFTWNPGDGSDVVDGEGGTDAMVFNGAIIGEKIDIAASADRAILTRDIAGIAMNIDGIETITFNARGGADVLTVHDMKGTDVTRVVVDLAPTPGTGQGDATTDTIVAAGGAGNDSIVAKTSGSERIVTGLGAELRIQGIDAGIDQLKIETGAGNDTIDASALTGMPLTIDGGTGNDVVKMSAGDDTFLWKAGDGNDVVHGNAGSDTIKVTGRDTAETISVAASGQQAVLSRDGASAVTFDGVERLDIATLGGGDNVVVGELAGTGVTAVNVDLGVAGAGDAQADAVTVRGTAAGDVLEVFNNAGTFTVTGAAAAVTIANVESIDSVTLAGGAGNDTISALAILPGAANITLDGGAGNDTITGSRGADTLLGGIGNDTVSGNMGADIARLGDGDDTFVWNPGDGNDVVEGDAGTDTLSFNGSNIGEKIDISANAGRVGFTRDIAGVAIDMDNVETIVFTARGGNDQITLHDLSGTDLDNVVVDFAANPGSAVGDVTGDIVDLLGGANADGVTVKTSGSETVLDGLGVQMRIQGADAGLDQVRIATDAGNDTIDASAVVAGGMVFTIDSGVGSDTVTGTQGADILFAGAGNDVVTGAAGNDRVFLGEDDDTFVWNAGDGSDIVEGELGTDTLRFNGSAGDELIMVTPNGGRLAVTDNAGNVTLDLGGFENVVVNGGGGNDTIVGFNGLSTLVQLTIDGGAGNDSITGGDGADLLLGGDGNDVVNGGRGNDTVKLGIGDDTFVWNPGDGSDVVDGEAGNDTMQFNGANIGETIGITANGSRVTFTRNIAGVAMDVGGVETIAFTARGGSDLVSVGELGGTGVQRVTIDLAATPGSGTGDGEADRVSVAGSGAADSIVAKTVGGEAVMTGLSAEVRIAAVDAGVDQLAIAGGAGNDTIDASALTGMVLSIEGGAGNDVVTMSAGDDTFTWNAGDGNDVVHGNGGNDAVKVNGADAGESIAISGTGGKAVVSRDGATALTLDGVERIDVATLGGGDNIVVGDLTGTGVTAVNVDLAVAGLGDGQADVVTVRGTGAGDVLEVFNIAGTLTVTGASAAITVTGAEAIDTLTLAGGAGNDTISAVTIVPGGAGITLDGGDGNDTITGSRGADTLLGGAGNDTVSGNMGADVARLGDGDDTFVWNPGDGNDIVEGDAGSDTLSFNGSNIGETIDISAGAGGRVALTRNIATVAMDMDGVETIAFSARGGADSITVHDMTGTDVGRVRIDLSSQPGSGVGDGANDFIAIEGTSGDDHITLSIVNGQLVVDGLPAQIVIDNFESGDAIRIAGLGGNDTIDARALPPGVSVILDGGEGDDILIGGAGDDLLIGGPGLDSLDGGPGNNVVLQEGFEPLGADWETPAAIVDEQPMI